MLILNSSLLDLEELLIAKTPIRSRIVSTSFWYLAKNPVFKISFEGQGIGTPQFRTGRNPKIFEINSHMIFSRRRWNLILKLSSQFKNTICHGAISIRTFTSFGSTPTFTMIPTYYEKVQVREVAHKYGLKVDSSACIHLFRYLWTTCKLTNHEILKNKFPDITEHITTPIERFISIIGLSVQWKINLKNNRGFLKRGFFCFDLLWINFSFWNAKSKHSSSNVIKLNKIK